MFGKSEKLLEEINNMLEAKLNLLFANSFNFYLDQFRELVNHEKELIEESANEAIEKIDTATNKLTNIDEVVNANKKLSEEVLQLINEIRKRDAKLDRKEKEIKRLKEKNEI